jgi:hypothetical protein
MNSSLCTTPQAFVKELTETGVSISSAVLTLASVLCIKERRAWLLYTERAAATPAQILLLCLWKNEPQTRKYWKLI